MTHSPPVPPANQSPYPRHEPPHPPAPSPAPTEASTSTKSTQAESVTPGKLAIGALVGIGAAALAFGAFFLREPDKKGARKKSTKRAHKD